MKRLLTITAMACLTLTSPAVAQEDITEIVIKRCTEKWGNDFAMIEYCYSQISEAAIRLQPVFARVKANASTEPELAIALGNCIRKWEWPEGGADYTMVEYCWEQQYEAYKRIKGQ